MTEQKIEQQFQNQMESSNQEEDCQLWGSLVTKNPVRLKIWQILQLFGELNVTQISNLLKESKSTVSRHLNSMEIDELVNCRKVKCEIDGRITPKLFSINYEMLTRKCGMEEYENIPEDFIKRMDFIKSEIQTNRSSIAMIKGLMNTLLPIYAEVEDLIKKKSTKERGLKKVKKYSIIWAAKNLGLIFFVSPRQMLSLKEREL